MRAVLLGLVAIAACDRGPHERQLPKKETEPRPRRVIEPPAGIVRPLPPHLISAAGVGPYRLGDKLTDLLQQLPSGPRIAVFEIPSVLHRSLIRAEEGDSVRIGGDPNGTASFVAVLDPQVARTETGVHVGSTRAELAKASPLLDDPTRAHDPQLLLPQSPRGMRVLFDPDRSKDRIAAIVVTTEGPLAMPARAASDACVRPAATAPAFGACLTGNPAGELVEVVNNDVTIRIAEGAKPIPLRLPATVVFAAPLRVEGRDELAIVTRTDEPAARTWSLVVYRFDSGKLVRSVDPAPLYSVSAANARWIGVELEAIDLYLELAATADAIEVGGLLTTRADLPDAPSPWRDVVVISPVTIARKHGKSAPPEGSGAGVPPPSSEPAPDAAPADAASEHVPGNP